MTMPAMTTSAEPARPQGLLDRVLYLTTLVPHWLIALLARVALLRVFWWSARTKVADGTLFTLSDSAVYLFQEEYKLPLVPPEIAAHLALLGESVFSVLVILGLATRLGALGLFFMTLVIQVFVYPESYNEHVPWMVCALYLVKFGGGFLSLDALIARRLGRTSL
ncbi:DoxX family protein [Labrys monachus]|uniref:Oxidoreductase n=1 Tax=Labrys monachus TaxID=217067 RepID=A0ABU0FPX9_9HYPH|nr:DoxX family protein [Labrys monachus]MDQ0396105.1 putative oxidoreductase [Labrys monachus]